MTIKFLIVANVLPNDAEIPIYVRLVNSKYYDKKVKTNLVVRQNLWDAKREMVKYKAWYDDKGVWIQTVTEVLLSDVPQNIKNYLQESQYGGATFEDNDAEYYQTQSQDDFYRFDLLIGGREIEVDVNTNGTVTQAQYGYFL